MKIKKFLFSILVFLIGTALCFVHYSLHDVIIPIYELILVCAFGVVWVLDWVLYRKRRKSDVDEAVAAKKRWKKRFLKFAAVYIPTLILPQAASMALSWRYDVNFALTLPYVPALFLTISVRKGFVRFRKCTPLGAMAQVSFLLLFLLVTDIGTELSFILWTLLAF